MTQHDESYTMEQALEEAYGMLENRFGKVEQGAAVALAGALLNSKPRENFAKRLEEEDDVATL